VQRKIVVIIAFLSIFIAVGSISPVLASSQLEVTIDPNSDTAIAKMTYQRSVNIDYSDGGKLAETMYGKNNQIIFSADSSNPSVQSLISKLNSYMASQIAKLRLLTLLWNTNH